MNRDQIQTVLPHRDAMLLLDSVALIDGEAVGSYTIKGNEFFLQGHFPGNPVVPGVMLCEMMGQAACVLVDLAGDFTPYFTGMNNVKFRNKVLPGDTITLRSRLEKKKGSFYFIWCTGHVGDTLCVSGELSFAVVKGE